MNKFSLLILLLIFSACCWNEPYEDIERGSIIYDSIEFDIQIDLMNCLDLQSEIVLRDERELRHFIDTLVLKGCDLGDTSFIDKIDFSKYSILAKTASIRGCNPYFIREVQFLQEEQEVIYSITKGDCGCCDKSVIGSANKVLVSPIPKDFVVKFVGPN